MEFYFLNLIQLSYDFGKVVLNGTTQGKVCLNEVSNGLQIHTCVMMKVLSKSNNFPQFG
jgi:hypothetical protein